MIIEAWIVMNATALDALWPMRHLDGILSTGVRGFWKDVTPNEVVNVIGEEQLLADFVTANSSDIVNVYSWVQGTGRDSLGAFPTDPAGVLNLMLDVTVYDSSGNVISSTPATIEAPNWGHVFLGQKERVFAGDFSTDFSEDYF